MSRIYTQAPYEPEHDDVLLYVNRDVGDGRVPKMVWIIDPDNDELGLVFESEAETLLSHLNRGL